MLLAFYADSASAERTSRTVTYFTVGGATALEVEEELVRNGPHLNRSGRRHPGATQLEFSNRITYARSDTECRVMTAVVTVKAEVILPRWRRPSGADAGARLYWDEVSAEIVRHEEGHLVIARNHAREIERRLKALRPGKTCDEVAERAKAAQQAVMAKHDAEQLRFDRVEGRALDRRLIARFKRRLDARGGASPAVPAPVPPARPVQPAP